MNLLGPDDFSDDPYGYVTNQIGHVYIGVWFVTLYCFVFDKFAGFPDQVWAVALVVGAYFLWWELVLQGWRGFDTIEDTFYFLAGGSVYLVIDMEWVIDRVFAFFLVMWIPLLAGAVRRYGRDG